MGQGNKNNRWEEGWEDGKGKTKVFAPLETPQRNWKVTRKTRDPPNWWREKNAENTQGKGEKEFGVFK